MKKILIGIMDFIKSLLPFAIIVIALLITPNTIGFGITLLIAFVFIMRG